MPLSHRRPQRSNVISQYIEAPNTFSGTNKIDQFERNSSQLRGYLEYIYKVKNEYGSVLLFIQKERLHWDSTTPSGDVPFSNLTDYKILYNDWPYHIDETIKHLVVWTKFQIADDPITEDVKVEDKAYIENFIQETFCSRATGVGKTISRDQITWFRNWKSLKSVHALGKTTACAPLWKEIDPEARAHTHHALQSAS